MESATDALKMAAAVLIFVGALSMAIMAFTKARQAATNMLGKEKIVTYYDLEDKYTKNREVSIDTVISNMYSYKNTRTTILFYIGTVDSDNNITSIERLKLYNTNSLENEKKNSFLLSDGPTSTGIYGLDITDERTRNEPWTSTDKATKDFIDHLIRGNDYEYSSSRFSEKKAIINFGYNASLNPAVYLINLPADVKIIERVGHFNYEDIHFNKGQGGTEETYRSTNLTNSTIVFSNNETMENEEGNDKKVIQYIFIK